MKKLLACGLILSTLMSFGSVCFAGRGIVVLDDDSESKTEIDYHAGEDEDEYGDDYIGEITIGSQDSKETKKPRRPRKDKEESSSIKLKDRKELTYLRNKAMDLLHNYYEEGYRALGYLTIEIVEMSIEDLNEDCTFLNGQELPRCVVEALGEYLAKRAELAPGTMGAEKPLFIDCRSAQRIKQGSKLVAGSVSGCISEYRKANRQTADMEE